MNGINNPELIKRLNDRVPQTFDELMKRTRSFIQGEAAAADSKKSYSNYKSQEQPRRQSNDQSSNHNNSYRNQKGDQGNDKYTSLTKTPKKILATEGANFPKPPTMRTPEERRVGNGYCEYHGQKGHTTNECVQLRQLIDKLVKEGRLDHLRNTRQKVSQKFSRGSEISFPTLTADNTVVEPLTIEINAGGHDIHRMYIDGGASADILYEHCFQRLRPEVKSQLNPATMSPSPYNGIIGRPGISAIRAVPSTAYGMLKSPVDGGIVTIYNTTLPPRECNTVACDATQTQTQYAAKVINLKVAIHPDYPEQEVSIGGSLSDRGRAVMCALLQRNLDIFAWEPKHMTGVEELWHVLWAHRTTIKVSTGDTPFSLIYGTEAVIPVEIGIPTIRITEVNVATNDDERRIDLDLLEERHERAAICEAKAKSKMKGYYDAKVRGVSFRTGDFVYRANGTSHAVDAGKLGPKWEGPYEVTEALGNGAYKLRDMDGRELPRTWNICNLKRCYL
nr:reverse transcriptase domain-containing protein [Tanacetum cinerariifolium]